MMFQMKQLLDNVLREAQEKKRCPDPKKYREEKAKAEQELLDTGYDRR